MENPNMNSQQEIFNLLQVKKDLKKRISEERKRRAAAHALKRQEERRLTLISEVAALSEEADALGV